MLTAIRQAWQRFQEYQYCRSQEIRVGKGTLNLSKKEICSFFSASWHDGSTTFMHLILVILIPLFILFIGTEAIPRLIVGEDAWPGIVFMGGCIWLYCMMRQKTRYFVKGQLSKLFCKAQFRIEALPHFSEKKYFYLDYPYIVFTDRKPLFLLCTCTRFQTSRDWKKTPCMGPVLWLTEYLMVTLYLRIVWPYIFNPLQLAFLEYDRAAKRLKLRRGQKVLTIGCGSFPHHVRWKRRLGQSGHITALDLEQWVLNDSLRWEKLLEWFRSWLAVPRAVATHICGCASDIPLPDESFHVVIAIRCYLVSVEEALRVLKPGGQLLISNCGEIWELPDHDDPGIESIGGGWLITKPGQEFTESGFGENKAIPVLA